MKANKKRKNNIFSKKRLARALMVVFAASFLFFSFVDDSLAAASCVCAKRESNFSYTPIGNEFQANDQAECGRLCLDKGATHYKYGAFPVWVDARGTTTAIAEGAKGALDAVGSLGKVAATAASWPIFWALNLLLLGVFTLGSVLMFFAGMLMDWAINPNNFLIVVNSQAVLDGWKIIRDFLNIAFILVLLYSAFCTIFQIEKYHLKKILLMVVLMALLVNFSFPVARFIIDTSNVLMYYILGAAFPDLTNGSGLSGNIISSAKIVKMVMPTPSVEEIFVPLSFTVRALLATIFIFLMAITLLVVGALLVIRIVVLAVLIIFAPIGFVGAIFPSTKQYADDWWSQLFKQSFFGPIMIFMIYLALTLMNEMGTKNLEASIKKQVENNSIPGGYSDIIIAGTYTAIPVVILWVGLIAAQKMGAAGADVVVGKAKSIAGKVGGWAAKQPWRGTKALVGATGVPGGMKQAYDQFRRTGKLFGKQVPLYKGSEGRKALEAKVASKLGVSGAFEQDIKRRAEEHKKNNTSISELKGLAQQGDAAAAYRLAEDGEIDSDTFNKFMDQNKRNEAKEVVVKKAKKNRVDLVIAHKWTDSEEMKKRTEEIKEKAAKRGVTISDDFAATKAKSDIAREEFGKLSPDQWNDQYWKDIFKNSDDLFKKHNIAIEDAVFDAFDNLHPNAQAEAFKRFNKNNLQAMKDAGIV